MKTAAKDDTPNLPSLGELPIWQEAFFGLELLLLRAAPVYYGFGISPGDGSAVVIIPGFLVNDAYLLELYAWLKRIGYQPYFSGIGINADCPNLLIRRALTDTIDKALRETRRPVHLLGHSLGGLLARAAAGDRQEDVASVITLGSPFRGIVAHPSIQQAVDAVRKRILSTNGGSVLPSCYTGQCTCNFLNSLKRTLRPSTHETAIFTKSDGLVDWRYCITGRPGSDFEVSGTHIGLVFNPSVYHIIADRLADSAMPAQPRPRKTKTPRPVSVRRPKS